MRVEEQVLFADCLQDAEAVVADSDHEGLVFLGGLSVQKPLEKIIIRLYVCFRATLFRSSEIKRTERGFILKQCKFSV